MPTLDLSQDLLSANANFNAGDWADAEASASLKLKAIGELKRGINLDLGIGAAIELEANFHKFLAAGAQGQAFASAHSTYSVKQVLPHDWKPQRKLASACVWVSG